MHLVPERTGKNLIQFTWMVLFSSQCHHGRVRMTHPTARDPYIQHWSESSYSISKPECFMEFLFCSYYFICNILMFQRLICCFLPRGRLWNHLMPQTHQNQKQLNKVLQVLLNRKVFIPFCQRDKQYVSTWCHLVPLMSFGAKVCTVPTNKHLNIHQSDKIYLNWQELSFLRCSLSF